MSPTSANNTGGSAGFFTPAFKYTRTEDFTAWRNELERELMSRDPPLLGFIRVNGYDGTQPFRFLGRDVPPLCAGHDEGNTDSESDSSEESKEDGGDADGQTTTPRPRRRRSRRRHKRRKKEKKGSLRSVSMTHAKNRLPS
jgi:hypothetical protein